MIVRNDQDWAAWDFANLQALQLSTRQTLLGIAPYLERLQSVVVNEFWTLVKVYPASDSASTGVLYPL
jgi:hypothetical protein